MEFCKRRNASIHNIKETYKIIKGCDDKGLSTINQYSLEKKLGSGSSGKVKLARLKGTDEKFAIKILKKSLLKQKRVFIKEDDVLIVKNAFQDVLREIAIMKKLNHPNVIKLHEVLNDPEEDKMYLNYAESGQMIEWNSISNEFHFANSDSKEFLCEVELRRIFRDIVKGLYYLHNNDIIHRDLKPQNILFDEKNVAKIADFGISFKLEKNCNLNNFSTGTYHFMCPESGKTSINSNYYSAKMADLWSLGVTLFSFTFKNVPFDGETVLDILSNIEEKKLEFPNQREVSKELRNLIEKMLEKDPRKRITLDQIIEDEWMNMDCSPLKEEIDKLQVMVSESDIKNALLPIHTIVFIKNMVSRWRKRSLSRSKSPLSEGNSPTLGGVNFRPFKLSTYGKMNEKTNSKPTINLNEIAEAISSKQIPTNLNSPVNLNHAPNGNAENFDSSIESSVENTNTSSFCVKIDITPPKLFNLDMKYQEKNSDNFFFSCNN